MDEQLTGAALDARARELDIEGRSSMTADEKRLAVADAEAAVVRDVPVQDEQSEPGMESGEASHTHRVVQCLGPNPNVDFP